MGRTFTGRSNTKSTSRCCQGNEVSRSRAGRWGVSGDKAKVWVDASALALGVALEVDGAIIEDGAWLRPDDAGHINMAELDAVVKGLNLALSWQLKDLQLMTDSLTVYRWIDDALSGRARLKTKAAREMLIRRRVAIVLALVKEYDLNLTVTLVKSVDNKADALTRVPRRWLALQNYDEALVYAAAATTQCEQVVAEVHHAAGHPGVRRTLYFAKRRDPTGSKRVVSRIVRQCDICQSIDPAPVKWRRGKLEVDKIWYRLSCDVTHYRGRAYLTLIDCGPTRFVIWRPLKFCITMNLAEHLEQVVLERGAPEELLVDNDPSFRRQLFTRLTKRWDVRLRFRCAFIPSGNGIVQRCHRTIKVIAARKKCSVAKAVYLYNMTPRDNCSAETAPPNAIYRYVIRIRDVDQAAGEEKIASCPYKIGDEVSVRTPTGRCDTQYEHGTVTGIMSEQAVEINGIPRNVRDIRRRSSTPNPPSCMPSQQPKDDELLVYILEPADVTRRQVASQPVVAEPGQREDPGRPQIRHEDGGLRRSEWIRHRKQCLMRD
uniref:RNA-directed DNA polymerase n=1 Tax=Trichuris muris TaxID=70415 RepID=A0A5S6QIU7_TRIMR